MYVQGNALQENSSISNLATKVSPSQLANRRAYDVTKVLNDYKMLFRKEEYFYGKDKANLLAYFEIEDASTLIEDVLAYSYADTGRQELARILNLFLYGHISAQDISSYLKVFCQANQPSVLRVFSYLRFAKLMKFVSSFQSICLRNTILDAKLHGHNDNLSSLVVTMTDRENDMGHAQRDSLVFNQTPRKTQFNSMFREQASSVSASILRTVEDYAKHYPSGLAESIEAVDTASSPGFVKGYWEDKDTTKKEVAVG